MKPRWNALAAVPLFLVPVQDPDALYDSLQDIERMTPEVRVVQAVSPSVVFVETETTQRFNTFFGPRDRTATGSGTGVVIHADGYIVTNFHVVRGARRIRVSFDGDPWRYKAELVAWEPSEDLALLKIEPDRPSRPANLPIGNQLGRAVPQSYPRGERGFRPVRLGTSADLMQGERVVAIGNPHGQTHTVSTGIISGLHRNVDIPGYNLHFEGLIQTDASINFGNSGGPLLNVRGELIGINTAMNAQAENIGFAIPVDRVVEVLNKQLYPQARKTWMGFDFAPGPDLVVGHVWSEGPAAQAGICVGDRVVRVGGTPVATEEEYRDASLLLAPGETVAVTVERRGVRDDLEVLTWDRLDGVLFERLGITVRELDPAFIVVERVSEEGPGDQIGLGRGDLIPAIRPQLEGVYNAFRIRDRRTLYDVVSRLEPGVVVEVDVYRDENGDGVYGREELYKGRLKVQ